MRVWIDLANSPHVPLFRAVAEQLEPEGVELFVTARDHAQTVELARATWPDVPVVGGQSPPGRLAKGRAVAARVRELRGRALAAGVDVALSHGSYAQIVAAWLARIPCVTMMDYEYQPANHVAFRLTSRVLVPEAFPRRALLRFGAGWRVIRYPGFKEQLYLASFEPDAEVLRALGVRPGEVLFVMRPPPEGALYHRHENERFDSLLAGIRRTEARVVVLPRTDTQRERYAALDDVVFPGRAVDGRSLLALADGFVGSGGTMTREAALLGTPTYTVFGGRLAAVDVELIRRGHVVDLRTGGTPAVEKAGPRTPIATAAARDELAATILAALRSLAR